MKSLLILATIGLALFSTSFGATEFEPNDPCTSDSHCPKSLICNKKTSSTGIACEIGRCACPTDYKYESDTCKKRNTVGQSCTTAIDCVTGLTCKDSKCYKMVEKKLGDACDTTKDVCLYSSCISDKCDCATGYFKDGSKCRLRKYKEKCEDGKENCEGQFECKSNICECRTDTLWKKFKDVNGKDIEACYHKDYQQVSTPSKEGQACGRKSYSGSTVRNNQRFVAYCEEDSVCTECYDATGTFDSCRGGAASILGSAILLVASVILGKLF